MFRKQKKRERERAEWSRFLFEQNVESPTQLARYLMDYNGTFEGCSNLSYRMIVVVVVRSFCFNVFTFPFKKGHGHGERRERSSSSIIATFRVIIKAQVALVRTRLFGTE